MSQTSVLFARSSYLSLCLSGFLQVCGVYLNAINFFTMMMSIGLLVDFNMHILLRYYESPCATRELKVKDSLQTMGSSVVIGGLSTFLGVVPLLFATSVMMKTLFYGFWGMVVIGLSHGVILLPVLLSYFGPLNTTAVTVTHLNEDGLVAISEASQECDNNGVCTSPSSVCNSASPTSESSARHRFESDGEAETAKQAAVTYPTLCVSAPSQEGEEHILTPESTPTNRCSQPSEVKEGEEEDEEDEDQQRQQREETTVPEPVAVPSSDGGEYVETEFFDDKEAYVEDQQRQQREETTVPEPVAVPSSDGGEYVETEFFDDKYVEDQQQLIREVTPMLPPLAVCCDVEKESEEENDDDKKEGFVTPVHSPGAAGMNPSTPDIQNNCNPIVGNCLANL